jgi:hypothetical protein
MFVTSLTALAMSVRSTLRQGRSKAVAPTPASKKSPPTSVTDTVELSERAVTLAQALDADGEGLESKDESTDRDIALLKRASLRFHHQKVGKDHGTEKGDDRWSSRQRPSLSATQTVTGVPTGTRKR